MVEAAGGGEVVRFALPDGVVVEVPKAALVTGSAFFAPLADEPGSIDWAGPDLEQVVASLGPGAAEALPDVLRALGSPQPKRPEQAPDPIGAAADDEDEGMDEEEDDELGGGRGKSSSSSSSGWGALFSRCGLVRVFSVAHLLGSGDMLEEARRWAATGSSSGRLQAALADFEPEKDDAALRTALRYGLDSLCSARLLHAAAAADAAAALRVLLADEDALGDAAASAAAAAATGPRPAPWAASAALSPVDMRDAEGRTALQLCAVHNSAEAAALLIDASANVEALCDIPEDMDEDDAGPSAAVARKFGVRTALHLAAINDSAEVAQLLLERKANVAACLKACPFSTTPLHECAAADAGRAARILALAAAAAAAPPDELWRLATGAGAEGEGGGDGHNDGTGAKGDGICEEVEEVRWARFLDPLQAKVGSLGLTPLHKAAEEEAPSVVKALLDAKADPSLGDEHGDTPVHCAVLYAAPRALAELLSNGADPACENNSGELPLHYMAEFGVGPSAEEVPEAIARRHFARSLRAQRELLDGLQRSGRLAEALARGEQVEGNTALHAIARHNHLGAEHAARLLVEARADPETRNRQNQTAMSIALRRFGAGGRVVKALASLGVKVEATEPTPTPPAPSHAGGAADGAGAAGAGTVTLPLKRPAPSSQDEAEDETMAGSQ